MLDLGLSMFKSDLKWTNSKLILVSEMNLVAAENRCKFIQNENSLTLKSSILLNSYPWIKFKIHWNDAEILTIVQWLTAAVTLKSKNKLWWLGQIQFITICMVWWGGGQWQWIGLASVNRPCLACRNSAHAHRHFNQWHRDKRRSIP